MRFQILGPLRVGGGAGAVVLGGRAQQTILAVLLANSGQIVPFEYLVEAVWDDSPPATAKRQIQNQVATLRRVLAATGARGPLIITYGPGYRIEPDEGDLDAQVFDDRVRRGKGLAGDGEPAEAVAELRSALDLWAGPALFGLTGRIVDATAARLEDRRLNALEECVDLELGLGRHRTLVGELAELVAVNPLRERLVGQLMLALCRSGRQADALHTYHRLRMTLADELGVDPGNAAQQAYAAILTGDRPTDGQSRQASSNGGAPPARSGGQVATMTGAAAGTAAAGTATARCHLPRAVPDFVGRSATLAYLRAAAEPAATTPTILALGGMAGVGKTALAVHLAHRLAGRYPDAQLYLDLHGHADQEPDDPGAALSVLLRQLGVAAHRVPELVADRVALWRAELADRHALVLLDNVASSQQVAPLLPGASDTLVIVTSRRMLAGLDGAYTASVDVLPTVDAAALLHRIVGVRVAESPEATAELARLCGHLPLALRLAAARLARRSTWSVADLNEQLRTSPDRLGLLTAEDRTVGAALALSYHQLDDVTRRVFRALGGHPRVAFDKHAAAALAGPAVADIDGRLEDLVDAYLLETPTAGRYRLHDLLHDYASALLAAAPPEQSEAVRRLLAHYLHATASATAHYERPAARATLPLDEPPPTVPSFGGTGAAVGWLDANWLNVVAAVGLADAEGYDQDTWRLARALWPYVYRNGHNNELVETHQRALAATRRLGDIAAAATVHNYIASGYANLKRYDATEVHLRESYTARRRLGDQRGVITALNNLALLQIYGAGRPRDAVESCQEALELAERIGAEHDVYLCLRTSGFAYRMLGRFSEAFACLRRALAGFQRTGQTSWHSVILGELGGVYAAVGDHAAAVALFREALTMKQCEGNRTGAAGVLSELGEAYQALGHGEAALQCHREALAVTPDEHHVRPAVLTGFGRTLLARGDRYQALAMHREALAALGASGSRYERAKAHEGMAAALWDLDQIVACNHLRQALETYDDIGLPEASRVRRRLAEYDEGQVSAV